MKVTNVGVTEVKHALWHPRRGHLYIAFDIRNKEQVDLPDCVASDSAVSNKTVAETTQTP